MAESLAPTVDIGRTPRVSFEDSAPRPVLLRQQRLQTYLQQHPISGVKPSQVQIHFSTMPAHYWERVTKAELVWGLEAVEQFMEKSAAAETPRSTVVAHSRDYPERNVTKILVCSWDRPGLLAKIAAAFTALRVNILRADVYTRADGLALDMFEVVSTDQATEADQERLRHLVFLLEGALSEPPRFVSIWAGEFHKTLPRGAAVPTQVTFDNNYSQDHTVIRVEASDRLGLLHDLLRGLTECGLNVAEASVETDASLAVDAFHVTDLTGAKIRETFRLETVRKALLRSIG